MEFVPGAEGQLVWTNSALIIDSNAVFKGGVMEEAASLPDPFGKYRIR